MIKRFFSFLIGSNPNKANASARIQFKPGKSEMPVSVSSAKSSTTNNPIIRIITRISWIPPDTKIMLIDELQAQIGDVYNPRDRTEIFERVLKVNKPTAYKLNRTITAMILTQREYKRYIKDGCTGIEILGGYCDCKYCTALQGRKWPIRSPNLILPPYHIGCGCCISPVTCDSVSDPGPVDAEIYEHYKKFQHQFFKVSPECLKDKQIKEMLGILKPLIEQLGLDKESIKTLDSAIKKLEKTMDTQRHNDGIIDECLVSIKDIVEPKQDNPTIIKILGMINEQF